MMHHSLALKAHWASFQEHTVESRVFSMKEKIQQSKELRMEKFSECSFVIIKQISPCIYMSIYEVTTLKLYCLSILIN